MFAVDLEQMFQDFFGWSCEKNNNAFLVLQMFIQLLKLEDASFTSDIFGLLPEKRAGNGTIKIVILFFYKDFVTYINHSTFFFERPATKLRIESYLKEWIFCAFILT